MYMCMYNMSCGAHAHAHVHVLSRVICTCSAPVHDAGALTYSQLAHAAGAIAAGLAQAGVRHGGPLADGEGGLVPLLATRGLEMVCGIYGILLADAAYVPLDTKWPDDRLAEVVSQCSPRAAAASSAELGSRLSTAGCPVVLHLTHYCATSAAGAASAVAASSATAPSASPPAASLPPVTLPVPRSGAGLGNEWDGAPGAVYVFFTSGSTGKPKGVVVPHCGLVHRIRWFQQRYAMSPCDAHVLKHSYTFGLSEWELFWPLSLGGTLVLSKPDGEKDVEYLYHLMDHHRVPTAVLVPSVLRALLEHAELDATPTTRAEAPSKPPALLPCLEQIVTCGEALPTDLVHSLFAAMPHVQLDNLYGPTEGEMTVYRCHPGKVSVGASSNARDRSPRMRHPHGAICLPELARTWPGLPGLGWTWLDLAGLGWTWLDLP